MDVAVEAAPEGHPSGTGRVAVVFVDIDGFRNVNTAHGNRGGDALLLEVARRLLATVRERLCNSKRL